MRKQVDRYLGGLAHDFSVCVHPEGNGALDRDTPSLIGKEPLEAQVVPVVSSGKDAEEIHTVEVACSEEVEDSVAARGIGTELKPASLVACIHDYCKECPGTECLMPVTGDLHSDHRTCEDHMDCLGNIDQFAHPNRVQKRFEGGAVGSLADCGVKPHTRADVEEPDAL